MDRSLRDLSEKIKNNEFLIKVEKMECQSIQTMQTETSTEVNKIMSLLHEYAGFRVSDYLANKLQMVFRNTSATELQNWISQIEKDAIKNDLISLVEDLCNHETYFFRDKDQLDLLSMYIIPELIKKKVDSGCYDFKIWSAACSTGEEPYSLAMLLIKELLKHGLAYVSGNSDEIRLQPGCTVEVVGSDISRQAIRIATQGAYQLEGLDSFRQFPKEYLNFFSDVKNKEISGNIGKTPCYRQIKQSIKNLVSFKLFNLMSVVPPRYNFDIVLCRNVLIYIDQEKQKNLQTMLSQSLSSSGCLMLSPVDTFYCSNLCDSRYINDWVVYERK